MIKGLDHVTIIVKDLDGAVAQYKKILGAGAVQRPDPPPGTEQRRRCRPRRSWGRSFFNSLPGLSCACELGRFYIQKVKNCYDKCYQLCYMFWRYVLRVEVIVGSQVAP